MSDAASLWASLKDIARVVYPLEDFGYGMREFAINDNNGYLLQFGQPLDDEALPQTASLVTVLAARFAGRAVLTEENLTQLSAIEPVKPAGDHYSGLSATAGSTRRARRAGM